MKTFVFADKCMASLNCTAVVQLLMSYMMSFNSLFDPFPSILYLTGPFKLNNKGFHL